MCPLIPSEPIALTIENNRIVDVKGKDEAEALRRFLADMSIRLGDHVYDFSVFHFGVHPHAKVAPHQCPNNLHRRAIEHSHTCNLHAHIGMTPAHSDYPYWLHCTADIRKPTLKVENALVHDRGRLLALDHPGVKAIADKYPGRPT